MKRIEFLRKAGVGILSGSLIASCQKEALESTWVGSSDASVTNAVAACTVTKTETAGPFPTKSPGTLQRVDIRADRTGVLMNMEITILNANASCAVLKNAIVDIWYCDAAGAYSEYGGTRMQSTNYTNVHFLRGRQITDTTGVVKFIGIFPGWYRGRAPHIHVHIYSAAGASLLVTQIAFPKAVCDTVYSTARTWYTKGLQDTINENDGVFRDGYTDELAVLTGSVTAGYLLTHSIIVNGGTAA